MKLKERAMIVTLSISSWTARVYDKKVSKEVATQHNAPADIGRYTKRLLADAPSYDAIIKLGREIRSWHYDQTLPWGQDGSRILPVTNYMPYADQMRAYRNSFDSKVHSFVSEYPALRDHAMIVLNGLYRDEDYPSPSEIETCFAIEQSILPVPDGADFRVNLGEEEVAHIRARIEAQAKAAEAIAMQDLWGRLYSGVSHLVDRLSDPDAVFRDSLILNLREIVGLLPRLNLSNDPELETARAAVEQKISKYDPQALRDSKSVREKVAAEALAIQQKMAAYMGGIAP